MTETQLDLVQGTLDVLILKTLSWAPMHGYAIARWIKERTDAVILVEEGALYPALQAVQRGIKGAFLDREDVLGCLPDPAADPVAVHGAPAQRLEDEDIEGADVEIASGHGAAPADGVAIPSSLRYSRTGSLIQQGVGS